jgi:hypothetical protein
MDMNAHEDRRKGEGENAKAGLHSGLFVGIRGFFMHFEAPKRLMPRLAFWGKRSRLPARTLYGHLGIVKIARRRRRAPL